MELVACCLNPLLNFFRKRSQRLTYEGGRSSSAIVKYLSNDFVLSLIVFFIRRLKAIIYIVLRYLVPDPSDRTLVQPIMKLFRHWACFSQIVFPFITYPILSLAPCQACSLELGTILMSRGRESSYALYNPIHKWISTRDIARRGQAT